MNAFAQQGGFAVLGLAAILAALVVGLAFAGSCW